MKTELVEIKIVEIFEYKKNNDKYWDGAKLYKQVVNKVLLIAQVFYTEFSLFFLFDNITNYSIYFKDVF